MNNPDEREKDSVRKASFPVVCLGASAGGLASFEAFFSSIPVSGSCPMAFIVIQHLAPDYESLLPSLIQKNTRMQVFGIEEGMIIQPNSIYVIPPGKDLTIRQGMLYLKEPSLPHGQRHTIDSFFCDLATDLREKAIGIVLSGTGNDGSMGIRAIKGEGGIVMVQKPDFLEYDSMPKSAISTGLVDFILSVEEMPARLFAYATQVLSIEPLSMNLPVEKNEHELQKIFFMLRTQTGHDFSSYKSSTVHRRIERRMALHQINSIENYVILLHNSSDELIALFRDFLIGVTGFFRDSEAFSALETQIIPAICANKKAGEAIRIWVPGCSSGEEPFSLAMLFTEYLETASLQCSVQIFATDIDHTAIARARSGLYSVNSIADISPQRLSRFFTVEANQDMYRINKKIRDMLIYSEQDLIRDPPFSRLDLVSCRNLLIYLGSDLQKKIIPMFHYALNAKGFLFLGTSETVGPFDDHFSTIDRKGKIYQRKDVIPGRHRFSLGLLQTLLPSVAAEKPTGNFITQGKSNVSLRELTEQALLQHLDPSGALVDGKGNILYLHGKMGQYLELFPGETGINNILKMTRETIQAELSAILSKSVSTNQIQSCLGSKTIINGIPSKVNMIVRPVTVDSAGEIIETLYLVIIEKAPVNIPKGNQGKGLQSKKAEHQLESDARIVALNRELKDKDDYLQNVNEEMQSSNEELKSSNEEMQSVNEELQSTNEELETSKEELQSVNEELATVNAELQIKILELSRSNNDMNNMLAGTGIGTVFVDQHLHILRFTPAACKIINLIPGDVGRPVGHLASNMKNCDCFVADVRAVLDTLKAKESEIQTIDNLWYLMRIQPYRASGNIVEGAVITFVDITETKKIKNENDRLEQLLKNNGIKGVPL